MAVSVSLWFLLYNMIGHNRYLMITQYLFFLEQMEFQGPQLNQQTILF